MTLTPEQRASALAYLLTDSGSVPCSRYGTDSASCAPVAVAFAEIAADANGEPLVFFEDFDYFMGLVVNDHDDVESLIRRHGSTEQRALIDLPPYGTVYVNDLLTEAGCYVHDRQTPDDMAMAVLDLADDLTASAFRAEYEAEKDAHEANEDGPWLDQSEVLADILHSAEDALNEATTNGSWRFDGERGGFFLDCHDDDDD